MTTLISATDTVTRDALAVLQPGFTGTTAPDWVLRRVDEGLASVALFGRNIRTPEQVTALTAQLRAERDDLLVAIDEEGGDVTRLEVRTGSSFPGNLALGHVDDLALTRAVAQELGRRLAECGVNLNWAPSADVNSNPGNPIIGVRSFGADTALVARHTAAYIEGLQAAGVAACTKHFPGHGDTAIDSHHAMPRIDVDLETLHARELVPFRAAIAAGSKCVMSAHILLPALDPDRPATVSPRILTGLLRQELGYDGLIVTDAVEMQAIAATYGIEQGSVLAIAAGADALCVGGGLEDDGTVLRLRDALVRAVRSGELPEERLADAAARVRALASWTQGAKGAGSGPGAATQEGTAPGTGIGSDIGLVAARRAVLTTGSAAPLTEPAYVAAFTSASNIAVGDETPWGVAAELGRLLPGTETDTYSSETEAPAAAVLRAAGERRIVVVVRDVHRHAWMGEALDALVAERPGTVVVEMGVPQAAPRGALHIATHGAARVCGLAAAEIVVSGTEGPAV
ncbi:glycoside hydrolase family 3 protein [Streptomyces sp. NBC_00264]|uniref:glycoside hydrolase family 3 protein n=1 Tax=unclassified Streptomyces TaxID=2593676 RepID=UPI002252A91C|nr:MULTISPECIES: glycoside hydrolase family 3 protein [unclassified Streptomyces]MCX5162867.1 glycoside hydrolase family 3 protein [Streptomyces sp. NBC_00305]MCX5221384.1 glycoside hydrolase family 3 protein [Streptomyces sp. NBC_00264]WSP46688.1 glycoside hydrolase family 3 protein [Streptomyces sp. NBC_01243]